MAEPQRETGEADELRQLSDAVEALRARLAHIHAVGEDPEEVRDSPFAHLFERVRAEVGERRHGAATGATAALLDLPRLEALRVAVPASLRPPPPIEIRGEYTLGELLAYEGEDFVANAYRALLGREHDAEGMAHWLDCLYTGERSKMELLAVFHDSEEGRRRGVIVHGLARAARIQRWRRLPVIGPVIAILHLVLRLPTMARDLEHQEMLLFRRKRELRATIAAVEALGARDAAALKAFGDALQGLNRTKASREGAIELGGRVAALRYDIARLDVELQRRAKGGELLRIGHAMAAAATGLHSTITAVGERTDQLPRIRQHIRESDQRVEAMAATLEDLARRKAEAAEVEPRLDAAEQALRGKAEAAEIEPRLDAAEQALRGKTEMAELMPRFEAIQQRLDAKAEGSEVERRLGELSTRAGLEAILAQDGQSLDQFYLDFEDRFRGTRDDIRARVAIYLPHVTGAGAGSESAPILDVGCGRGEWLELLRDSGLSGRGLDLNARMVESCRERGLAVEEAEAVAYLEGLEEGSLGAVTGMHIIEHIPFRQRLRFLDAALRALRPGGMVILETPNPENLTVGACSFWIDPTHIAPIPPESLRVTAELRGFLRAEIVRLHPIPAEGHLPMTRTPGRDTLNHVLYGPQDYAILAYKAPTEATP